MGKMRGVFTSLFVVALGWLAVNPAPVLAETLPSPTVILAPSLLMADEPSFFILSLPRADQYEGRLRVRSGDKESGSVRDGDTWTANYLPLNHLANGDQLNLNFHISSSLPTGPATVVLSLRRVGSSTRLGEITLGSVELINPNTAQTQALPSSAANQIVVWQNGSDQLVRQLVANEISLKAPAGGTFSLWQNTQLTPLDLNTIAPAEDRPSSPSNLAADALPDGQVNVRDASRIQMVLRSGRPTTADPDWSAYDVNSDGLVSQTDVQLALDAGVGLSITSRLNQPPVLSLQAILPSPSKGDLEWIELCSTAHERGRIGALSLADVYGATKTFDLTGRWIDPGQCLHLTSAETKITLNNDKDEVVLLGPDGQALDRTSVYQSAKTGQAWRYQANGWGWINTPPADQTTADTDTNGAGPTDTGQAIQTTPHEANLLLGQLLQIEGEVDRKTTTGFYLADSQGEVRIYLAPAIRAALAKISKSQLWRVQGKLEEYRGSRRLAVLSLSDLLYIGEADPTKKAVQKATTKKAAKAPAKKSTLLSRALSVPKALAAETPPDEITTTSLPSTHKREAIALTALILVALLWLFLYREEV